MRGKSRQRYPIRRMDRPDFGMIASLMPGNSQGKRIKIWHLPANYRNY